MKSRCFGRRWITISPNSKQKQILRLPSPPLSRRMKQSSYPYHPPVKESKPSAPIDIHIADVMALEYSMVSILDQIRGKQHLPGLKFWSRDKTWLEQKQPCPQPGKTGQVSNIFHSLQSRGITSSASYNSYI